MKTIYLSFITLMMVSMQSFAGPTDSLKTIISGRGPIGEPNELTLFGFENSLSNDDEEHLVVDPDGSIDCSDYIVSADGSNMYTPTATNSSQSLGSSRVYTFTFKTYSSHAPAELIDNTGMFKMTKTKLNSGSDRVCVIVGGVFPFQYVWRNYTTWKITVTYKPKSYGTHTAKLYLYVGKLDNLRILLYKYTYTLTGVASRGSNGSGDSMYSNSNSDGDSDETRTNEWTNEETTSDVQNNNITAANELSMDVRIYPEGKNIIIESPVEQSAIISDVAGRARRVNLQAGRNEIPVNASGIYIVGIREKTAKLMIK